MKRTRLMVVGAVIAAITSVPIVGLGNSQTDGEAVGQAKKLTQATPLLCEGYWRFDLSLGVMRNGSGSMSTQDIWFTVTNQRDLATLRRAVESGAIVKVQYDERRWAPCSDDSWLTGIQIIN